MNTSNKEAIAETLAERYSPGGESHGIEHARRVRDKVRRGLRVIQGVGTRMNAFSAQIKPSEHEGISEVSDSSYSASIAIVNTVYSQIYGKYVDLRVDVTSESFVDDACAAALIHDCLDHKYISQETDEYETVRETLVNELGEEIVAIATSTSWSKRKEGLIDALPTPRARMIAELLQSADWWDALNLERCIQFSKEQNNFDEDVRKDVITHAHTKLLHIYGELSPLFQTLAKEDHEKFIDDLMRFSLKE